MKPFRYGSTKEDEMSHAWKNPEKLGSTTNPIIARIHPDKATVDNYSRECSNCGCKSTSLVPAGQAPSDSSWLAPFPTCEAYQAFVARNSPNESP